MKQKTIYAGGIGLDIYQTMIDTGTDDGTDERVIDLWVADFGPVIVAVVLRNSDAVINTGPYVITQVFDHDSPGILATSQEEYEIEGDHEIEFDGETYKITIERK